MANIENSSGNNSEDGAITVSVARTVRPGMEHEYEDWIKQTSTAASRFPGHLGVNILRPSPKTDGKYVLIYRFDTYQHSVRWEESSERATLLTKLDALTQGQTTRKKITGLEFWFDLPTVPSAAKASIHKSALVLIVVVFALVYPLQLTVGVWLSAVPVWLKVLTIVILQVLLMTYIVMPRVTRLLKPWLFHIKK